MTPTTRASSTTISAAPRPPSAALSESRPGPHADLMPLDRAVIGHRHRPLPGDAQFADARENLNRTNLNLLPRTDHHCPQRAFSLPLVARSGHGAWPRQVRQRTKSWRRGAGRRRAWWRSTRGRRRRDRRRSGWHSSAAAFADCPPSALSAADGPLRAARSCMHSLNH